MTIAERVACFLRARYPRDTAKNVSKATGVPPATVAKWLTRTSAPSGGALVALCIAYPEIMPAIDARLNWMSTALLMLKREALSQALDAADAEARCAIDLLRGRR